MHCSNTLSNETIVCDRLARKIVLTIRQFLSSSGIDENKAWLYLRRVMANAARCPCRAPVFQPRLFSFAIGIRRLLWMPSRIRVAVLESFLGEANVDAFGNNAA